MTREEGDSGNEPDDGRTAPVRLFGIFLLLGCTSFGGPVAHLGFFREAFVAKRRWFSEEAYADLVALAQFLPGPASSQVGMMIGLMRGGFAGMLASWLGFTLPSALLMGGAAFGFAAHGDLFGGGWIGGLKAAAAAVVLQALIGMARGLAPDWTRRGIGVAAFAAVLAAGWIGLPVAAAQVGTILLGGVAGLLLCRHITGAAGGRLTAPVPRAVAIAALALFALLLAVSPLLTLGVGGDLFDRFYRAGALVFGGGHVVLPLLEAGTVDTGLVERDTFLAGYGAAQALPGPLFTIATFLGASAAGLSGALIATGAIFLSSMLLCLGALPFWAALSVAPKARRTLAGVNAAVVGLLAAAFVDPVALALTDRPVLLLLAAVVFALLVRTKTPVWLLVPLAGVAGALLP